MVKILILNSLGGIIMSQTFISKIWKALSVLLLQFFAFLKELVKSTTKICSSYIYRSELMVQSELLEKEQNYGEWIKIATRIDKIKDTYGWRAVPDSSYYDFEHVKNIKEDLERLLSQDKIPECMNLLRGFLTRDFSGITNKNLYNFTLSGTKELIDQYYDTVVLCLNRIADSDVPGKLKFFADIDHLYGRTGLAFSGGASIGMFHMGLISVLLEFELLPRVFCGSSAGAMACVVVGCNTNEELREQSKSNFSSFNYDSFKQSQPKISFFNKLKKAFNDGYLIDKNPLGTFLAVNTYNLTFLEAYEKTGRTININVTDNHHRKCHILNHLTAPNVFVWSAALASCSSPVVFGATTIICKGLNGRCESWMPRDHGFIDGSIGADVPLKKLSVMFDATSFIVSQVNFFVIPFISFGSHNRLSRKYLVIRLWEIISGFFISEFRHRLKQLSKIGLIPMRLSLVVNMVTQKYFGNITIFPSVRLKDYLRLYEDPNAKGAYEWTLRGRNSTFMSKITRPPANH
jgi:predicted acylesterase/phospholipase RssA